MLQLGHAVLAITLSYWKMEPGIRHDGKVTGLVGVCMFESAMYTCNY